MKIYQRIIMASIYAFFVVSVSACSTYSHEQDIARNNAFEQEDEIDITTVTLTAEDKANRITLEDKRAALKMLSLQENKLKSAYENGVRDTLEDFKGRMDARKVFTYEPPVVEYVEMPAQVINGVLYPARVQPVFVTPGRYIENNGILLPNE